MRHWQTYLWPRLYTDREIEADRRKKHIVCGLRFGKTGMVYHKVVDELPISKEQKQKLHEQYEKLLRGEE